MYFFRLSSGIDAAYSSTLTPQWSSFSRCPLANVSLCEETETADSFTVAVYNPLSRPRDWHVRLPVGGEDWTVTRMSDGAEVPCQALPIPQVIDFTA